MFRIEYLKVLGHPQLGELELSLSDIKEINNIEKPYTSVIIGPNGTGKSFILRTISDILTQFNLYQLTGIKSINLPFSIHLRYKCNSDIYEMMSGFIVLDKSKKRREYYFFKNRPFGNIENIFLNNDEKKYQINYNQLDFPSHVIVNSVMLNDRFLFKKSKPKDFYQYLGVRATSSTASTKSAVKGVIEKLFSESMSNENFLNNLKELLSFLDFENKFEVEYNTKLNKLFFTGELTIKDFKQYYENWWDKEYEYTDRKKDNPIWSKPFYDNFYKEDESKIKEIVDYLNDLSKNGILKHKNRSRSKLLKVDFFDKEIDNNEYWKIIDLEKLDIINVNSINLIKNNSSLNINEISSGEYHLLISLIGIFSKIKENSLVLIDEPEISLHPNWQMQYITFLKKVFSKCASCHFIITSHSHFIVSDLEGNSSSVTALNRDIETSKLDARLLSGNTFGWSAEDVLYNVFNVRSVRNYFIQADLTDLLGLISENSKNKVKIMSLVKKLNELQTSENDPLKAVLIEANSYLDKL
ncbi:AAA family ATPase [Flavobacterium macrobrachii]|uniref:AAA family ATPase n=1 Tax=Flavobacterium macrobrachii TaxID=591204 RepID=UPI003F72A1DC